jgi:hypothetical protein
LSSHLRLGLPSSSFPQVFPPKHSIRFFSPHTCYMSRPILLDFITRTILGEEYKSLSFSLWHVLQSPVNSSILSPNILLKLCS